MYISHEQAVITNFRGIICLSPSVQSAIFPDYDIIANEENGLLPFILEVLRHATYNSSGEYLAIFTHARPIQDNGIGANPAIGSNLHIFLNSNKRRDHCAFVN
jgi:hypothetical protein